MQIIISIKIHKQLNTTKPSHKLGVTVISLHTQPIIPATTIVKSPIKDNLNVNMLFSVVFLDVIIPFK
jgi:hypothetical protein